MDLPKPPEDAELKNIIDKLANFVARNGPEFEQMTKQKQQDNQKFSFLFGGENYSYYQYKVQTEQAIINVQKKKLQEQQEQQQQAALAAAQLVASQQLIQLQQQQPVASQQLTQPITGQQIDVSQQIAAPQVAGTQQITVQTPWQPQQVTTSIQPATVLQTAPVTTVAPLTPQQQVTNFQQQIAVQQTQIQQHQTLMDQQIKTSEQNLAAQYQSLMQQQQAQIEEAIFNQQAETLQTLSNDCELPLEDLDKTVKPIIDSCTKDAILTGKSWIFQNCTTDAKSELIAQYFLKRIISKEASFELRLHLIYLINDLLHHCQRKGADNLKKCLEQIVVAVFCTSLVGAGEDKKVKLNKLLALWEQNKYFDQDIIEKMKEPDKSLGNYHTELINENTAIVSQITASTQLQYASLQKQHTEFSNHLQNQLQQLQQQLTSLQTQLAQAQAAVIAPPTVSVVGSVSGIAGSGSDLQSVSGVTTTSAADPALGSFNQPPLQYGPAPPPGFSRPPPPFGDYGHRPWGPPPMPGMPLPDFSKPPPGFPPPGAHIPPPDIDLTPSVPYYELPAGLIAPLIKLEDHDYRPLDPKDIRLPPPMPPSERLLAAVEAFYSPPFHDRPRDSEGWEKLGLFEFFKAKQKAKKLKEMRGDRSRTRSRSRSRSRSHERDRERERERDKDGSPGPRITSSRKPAPSVTRRRFDSRSRSRSRSKSPSSRSGSRSRSYSRSQSGSRSRSRSRSPRRRSRSYSDSRSPLPYRKRSRSRSDSPRGRGRSRTRSKSRSTTPPTFSTEAFLAAAAAQSSTQEKLGEENKGHMLLKKMGWGGKGLGAKEQGIVNPIEAGEVRDRQDQFKGVGVSMNDPFEQFRKNKSQGFINRMKARDDGKKKEDKS